MIEGTGITLTEIFEMCFLICFAVAWPVSIVKSVKSRTSKGKSIVFEYFIIAGYCFGIAAKLVDTHLSYVIIFYIINLIMVLIDIALYYRNARLDKARAYQNCKCID